MCEMYELELETRAAMFQNIFTLNLQFICLTIYQLFSPLFMPFLTSFESTGWIPQLSKPKDTLSAVMTLSGHFICYNA